MSYPVNALVVGSDTPVPTFWCATNEHYVYDRDVLWNHGKDGEQPYVTCLECQERSCRAWLAENCPFCTLTAERVLGLIQRYRETGEMETIDPVPLETLPAHREGCRFYGR